MALSLAACFAALHLLHMCGSEHSSDRLLHGDHHPAAYIKRHPVTPRAAEGKQPYSDISVRGPYIVLYLIYIYIYVYILYVYICTGRQRSWCLTHGKRQRPRQRPIQRQNQRQRQKQRQRERAREREREGKRERETEGENARDKHMSHGARVPQSTPYNSPLARDTRSTSSSSSSSSSSHAKAPRINPSTACPLFACQASAERCRDPDLNRD